MSFLQLIPKCQALKFLVGDLFCSVGKHNIGKAFGGENRTNSLPGREWQSKKVHV